MLPVLTVCWLAIASSLASMAWLDIPSDPAGPFMIRFLAASLGWVVAAVVAYRRKEGWSRNEVILVLLGAALLRGVAWRVPILLETDVHRYLWDGFVLSRGYNPYQFAPDEVTRAQEEDNSYLYDEGTWIRLRELALKAEATPEIQEHLEQVNHPKIPTCYPPVAEWAFAGAAAVAPGSEWTWKAVVAVVDLAVCGLILLLLRTLGRPQGWVLFYAWCPLPIKEYANTGHYDPFATFFTVLAIYLLVRRRSVAGGAALGLGVAGKVYPLVLIPVLWRRLGWRGITAALMVPAGMIAPFLNIGPKIFDGLAAFAKDWEFNSSIFALVAWVFDRDWFPAFKLTGYFRLSRPGEEAMFGDYFHELVLDGFQFSKLITGLLLATVIVALARWREDADWSVPGRALGVVSAVVLLAPVSDPWYVPWFLPYACLFPALCWVWLAVFSVNYYAYFLSWKYLWWHRPVEYLPFYILLVPELRRVYLAHPGLARILSGRGPERVEDGEEPADTQE